MRPEIESQRLLPALFQRYFDANSLETGSSGLPGEADDSSAGRDRQEKS
jgi:hypothetical protein